VNTSSDPAWAAIQYLTMFGLVLWWVYAGGVLLGAIVVFRTKGWLRDTAWWSLRAQIAPVLTLLLLLMIWTLQLALNRALIPASMGEAVVTLSLAVGPVMSLWLAGALLAARLRAALASPSA